MTDPMPHHHDRSDTVSELDDLRAKLAALEILDTLASAGDGTHLPATGAADEPTSVAQVNRLLGVNLWQVRSFRADVRIDFDEHGRLLGASLLNPEPTKP